MRVLILFLLAGVASCASTPNPWNDLTVDITPAAAAVDCGSFPYPTKVVGEDVVYDNEGMNDLERYRVCSEANRLIVGEHAAQIMALKRSRAALVDAGQAQRSIADMRKEQLEDERKSHLIQSVGYWVVILGLAL